MRCAQCGQTDSAVIDSRETEEGGSVRRRRECVDCKFRFTTYERIEQPRLMVTKKSGAKELFDRGKLSLGIYKAFYKRPLSAAEIECLIDDIEREIYERNVEEIPTITVGEIVMSRIEKIDPVAYIRFAAVYREFTDLETFSTEIQKVINKNKTAVSGQI